MKLTQAALITLPVLVSSAGGLGRGGGRGRDRAGLLGADQVVEGACRVLNEQISALGVNDTRCSCTKDGKTGVDFSCGLPSVELEMSDDKSFYGNFNLSGSFDVDIFGKSFNLGLGTCFEGEMEITQDRNTTLEGCAEAKLCPEKDGSLELCGCTGTLNEQDCTCTLCPNGETGVKFDCGTLPFDIDLCFPAIELPF